MVLQQSPSKACLYGMLPPDGTGAQIKLDKKNDATFAAYVVEAKITPGASGGLWQACLAPQQGSAGTFTVTATCTGCSNKTAAVLDEVVFGDVYYCSGQSNMALPLMHTLSRNISRDLILAGSYSNIRIHGMAGNMNPHQPWATLKAALSGAADSDTSMFAGFSSTCYYFGESLTDELNKNGGTAPNIGLIHTAWGGSQIEEWLTNDTIATCANASLGAANQGFHDTRVMPYIGMTIAGWVWYQGENDMHNFFGNSALKTGYSCLAPALVAQYRALWSAAPGTTPADAPFGLVTLPSTGGEGGASIGTMRWAQTGSYGTAPNPAMPNVFVAQGYDLGDPWSNDTCYGKEKCHDNSVPPAGGWGGCTGYCESVKTTNWYMGPIHGRDKKPVGARLATTMLALDPNKRYFSSGPQLSGCSVAGQKIMIRFNKTISRGDGIKINPYYEGDGTNKGKPQTGLGSMMQVLTNKTGFCMQDGGRAAKGAPAECRDDGTGHPKVEGPSTEWVAVDITPGSDTASVVADLSKVNGTVYAIRYAWDGNCCSADLPTSGPCPIASCPIYGAESELPANPFVAHIVSGKCACIAPQVCDQ